MARLSSPGFGGHSLCHPPVKAVHMKHRPVTPLRKTRLGTSEAVGYFSAVPGYSKPITESPRPLCAGGALSDWLMNRPWTRDRARLVYADDLSGTNVGQRGV